MRNFNRMPRTFFKKTQPGNKNTIIKYNLYDNSNPKVINEKIYISSKLK